MPRFAQQNIARSLNLAGPTTVWLSNRPQICKKNGKVNAQCTFRPSSCEHNPMPQNNFRRQTASRIKESNLTYYLATTCVKKNQLSDGATHGWIAETPVTHCLKSTCNFAQEAVCPGYLRTMHFRHTNALSPDSRPPPRAPRPSPHVLCRIHFLSQSGKRRSTTVRGYTYPIPYLLHS
jgi:hypothetical protein